MKVAGNLDLGPGNVHAYEVRHTGDLAGDVIAYPFSSQESAETWLKAAKDGGELSLVGELVCDTVARKGGSWVIVAKAQQPASLLLKKVDPTRFPHRCPSCGRPAYINGMDVVKHAPDDRESCT